MGAKRAFVADPEPLETFRPSLTVLQEEAPGHAEPAGIVCRQCGCADLRVYRTVKMTRNRIRRERMCRHCGHKIITTEQEAFR